MYRPSGSEGEPREVAGQRPHRVFLGGVAVQEATAWPSQERGQGGGLEDSPGGVGGRAGACRAVSWRRSGICLCVKREDTSRGPASDQGEEGFHDGAVDTAWAVPDPLSKIKMLSPSGRTSRPDNHLPGVESQEVVGHVGLCVQS